VSALALGILMTMVGAPSPEAQVRTTTHDGIPLDEPILMRLHGVMLRIPAGYLAPWPGLRMRSGVNEASRTAFNFWMPSRRYVEISSLSIVGSRPRERGRPSPAPDAYVVMVHDFSSRAPNKLDYRSPEKQIRNLMKVPGRESYSFEQQDFDLVRFWRQDWPYAQPEPFVHFRHVEGSDPQILLRCTAPHRPSPNPVCDGDVYFASDELSFHVVFPRDQVSNWRNSILAVRDLFNSWKATQ